MAKQLTLIVTCEHGGYRVPARYRRCFHGHQAALKSHRGYDPGSLELARRLARISRHPLIYSTVSRLLVELNRSPGHPALWSEMTADLEADEKRRVLETHYYPHRTQVESLLARVLARRAQAALHLSVHTFTPVWKGQPRRADVGLLYDPDRAAETAFCRRWLDGLKRRRPDLALRRNYPYLGKADGLTTHFRRHFGDPRYLGVELEVNQRWPAGNAADWRRLQSDLRESLAEATDEVADLRTSAPPRTLR